MKSFQGLSTREIIAEFHSENGASIEKLKSVRARLYRLVSEVSEEINCLMDAQDKIEKLDLFKHESDTSTEQGL